MKRLKLGCFTFLAIVVTVSLARMSLRHLHMYGLIVGIPVAAYASYLVIQLAREEGW